MDAVLGRKKRCCCGLLRIDETVRCLTYVVILLNFYNLALWLLIYIKMIFGSSVSYDWLNKSPPYSNLNF